MFHVAVYVPTDYKDQVKTAMFEARAGRIGNYDSCCFEYEGKGQFRPLPGSHPAIGSHGELETVQEIKIEMVCSDEFIEQVIDALKKSHPYETPAYYVIKTLGF